LIERVCEKLYLPNAVMGQAIVISMKILSNQETGINTAAISAYSVMAACKIEGISKVGLKEIVDAHKSLGRRVKVSSLVRLYLESPVKQRPRNASEYIKPIIARVLQIEKVEKGILTYFSSKVDYMRNLYSEATELIEKAKMIGTGGHNPRALAAASVYGAEYLLSRREKRKKVITQKDIALSSGMTEYTIREQFGEIFRELIVQMVECIEKNNMDY
jgi:transcription initiation factor TFIIIB Brf1 subunit/transcription initiation factor TFIIB